MIFSKIHKNHVFLFSDYSMTVGFGNIRLKYTKHLQTGEIQILEEDHYYPYACPVRSFRGLTHQGYQSNHQTIGFDGQVFTLIPITPQAADSYKYKFNGMEWQDEFDINLYDFGARNYDPALGRWMNMDPITHHGQSPYVAFDNNPIYYTDPDGKSTQPPTKNIQVTIITSTVDKNNVTTITQTTYDNTYTKNNDGSMSVTSSKSEITNTVNGDGQISKGSSVRTTTDSYNVGTDGQKSDASSSSEIRSANANDTHSAFGEWTDFVSDYNKNHNEVYNKDMINKGSDMTTIAADTGTSLLGFGIPKTIAKFLPPISVPGGSEISGSSLSESIGKNNQYLIIYGVQEIHNGTLIKPMKSPSNRPLGARNNGPRGGFKALFNGFIDLFKG